MGTGDARAPWGEAWSALGWVQLMWDHDGNCNPPPTQHRQQSFMGASWACTGQPQHHGAQVPQQSHPSPSRGHRELQKLWMAAWGWHWWLLAGSPNHDCSRMGLLCPVCLQPPCQPATRHPKPCARLPGASQAGSHFTICTFIPGLCQNTLQEPRPLLVEVQPKCRVQGPLWQQLRELGRAPHPRDVSSAGPLREAGDLPNAALSSPCP